MKTLHQALTILRVTASALLDLTAWLFVEIGNGLNKASTWLLKDEVRG